MITTHVLDTSVGRPARNVPVRLEYFDLTAGDWRLIGAGNTDDDGRLRTLTPAGPVDAGRYRLTFDTEAYFAVAGTNAFFPVCEIQFEITDGAAHYHVPLLLAPFGYATYRGS